MPLADASLPFGWLSAAGPHSATAEDASLPFVLAKSAVGALSWALKAAVCCCWLAHQRWPIYAVTADTVRTAPAICRHGVGQAWREGHPPDHYC